MNAKLRILVVDDDPTYRQLLTQHLTREGYEILLAKDGQEALAWVHHPRLRPALIVLDLLMPRFSGIDLLKHLEQHPDRPPVILVSGSERPIVREGIQQASPDAFLAKPFILRDLLEKIQTLLP